LGFQTQGGYALRWLVRGLCLVLDVRLAQRPATRTPPCTVVVVSTPVVVVVILLVIVLGSTPVPRVGMGTGPRPVAVRVAECPRAELFNPLQLGFTLLDGVLAQCLGTVAERVLARKADILVFTRANVFASGASSEDTHRGREEERRVVRPRLVRVCDGDGA
jgi:hypothetical protein